MTGPRAILHVDMDAFFASVEQRDDPALRGRPVLVGGTGRRGVVAAASYEARAFGCRSAQPTAVARRLCPEAIVVRPRGSVYREVSTRIFEIFESFTPIVQPLSVDEAFLDVTGSLRLFGPAPEIARQIRARIRDAVNLTASVGVAPNKFLAKLASDLDKPDGLTVVPEDVRGFLESIEIGRMWGVGPATEERLRALGVHVFADLLKVDEHVLEQRLGSSAARLRALAAGEDHRPVVPDSDGRTISHEQTFGSDLADPEEVRRVLSQQVEAVARRVRRHELFLRTVTVKIRFGDFKTITRSSSLREATDRTDVLWEAARTLFNTWAKQGFRPVRLVGVGASNLSHDRGQLGLFDALDNARHTRIDQTTDVIHGKYGREAIRRGTSLPPPEST